MPAAYVLVSPLRRLLWMLGGIAAWTLLLWPVWRDTLAALLVRLGIVATVASMAFSLLECWPRRLPRRCPRWVLQVLAVALSVPLTTALLWIASTPSGGVPFYADNARAGGFLVVSISGLLFAPWIALGALVRQKEALVHRQSLAFALERSELEREALLARLQLMQAQVHPHFLFNTLANVQALVQGASAHAADLLGSLTDYLRAAIPQPGATRSTLQHELSLTRAYLELMHMRMPDRLRYRIDCPAELATHPCPPLAILTLVENAIRHGVDPSVDGAEVQIAVQAAGDAAVVQVMDTGVGLQAASQQPGQGSGLSMLRERLRLMYGPDARLELAASAPHGTVAILYLPASTSACA